MAQEIDLEMWNQAKGGAWVDSDGDIGVIDSREYSIILSPEGAIQLRNWLNKVLPNETLPSLKFELAIQQAKDANEC